MENVGNSWIEPVAMRLTSIIAIGIAVHCAVLCTAETCLAEYPDPIPATKPLVRLLPQIEELNDDHLATDVVPKSHVTKKWPKQAFPASRFFFLKKTASSSLAQASPEQAASVEPTRDSQTAIRPTSATQPELMVPVPAGDEGHSLSTNLITPQMMGIEEIPAYCDEAHCVESTYGVFPKTPKVSTRFRFPGIAKLLNQ